jgi:hypothetical protein
MERCGRLVAERPRSTVSSPIFFKSWSSRSPPPLSLFAASPFENARAAFSMNSRFHL